MEDAASSPELAGRCLTCDYPLRGLPENRCPECGRPFDPADPSTMNMGRRMGPDAKRLLKPAGKPLNIPVAALALVILVGQSAPGGYAILQVPGVLLGLFVGAVWLLRLIISLCLARYYRQPTYKRGRVWLRWSVCPAIAAATACLLLLNVPLRLSFWISRPAMERLAREVMLDPMNAPTARWVGLYHAEDIEAFVGGMRFRVSGTPQIYGDYGFTYDPSGPPPPLLVGGHQRLSQDWYIWSGF